MTTGWSHWLTDPGDDPGPMPTPSTPAQSGEDPVEVEVRRIRTRQAAADRIAADRADNLELPPLVRLDEFLAQPDPVTTYRVNTVWPSPGRVLLAAAWKAGKTTLRDELIRSLVDGVPFLGRYDAIPASDVVLVDNELSEPTLRRWLRDHGIEHAEAVRVLSLRGRVHRFAITDPAVRARWAKHIGPAEVLLFDCLRPSLDALGLSEHYEAGIFLAAFDALLYEAGIADAAVLHHMGHGSERSRGDSRLRDWPDAEWRLVREVTEDQSDPDPAAPRYFSAYGRDVDIAECRLYYEPTSRHLTVAGGSRASEKIASAGRAMLELLDQHPAGVSSRFLEDTLTRHKHVRADVREAVDREIARGHVVITDGAKNAKLHFLTADGATHLASVRSVP